MSEIVVTTRKWGNSIGVTLPMKTVLKEGIKPNEKVVITIQKAGSIKDLFGSMKTKRTTEEIMKEVKKGWD